MSENRWFIPRDFSSFFGQPSGHSLVIRGGPGTGKTTFALQLLEEIVDPDRSFYLSTRVSNEALFTHFPWLKKEEMKRRIIDSSRILLETIRGKEHKEPETREKLTKAREFLRTIGKHEPTTVDRSRLSALTKKVKMPEMEILYDRIEKALPSKPMLVIDSIEGMTSKYDIEPNELVSAVQKDLVENSNTNTIFIVERTDTTNIEYLVDGVISLTMNEIEGRRFRGLHLIKLRATEIHQPNYLVTLQNGRFRCFESIRMEHGKQKKWEPLPDAKDHYSTGITALDAILGGGFRKGSYNVIEVGNNVSIEEYSLVRRCMVMNFIAQNRGMIGVMTGGVHPELLRTDLSRFIGTDKFDRFVRIADYFTTDSEKSYVMPLGMKKKEEGLKIWMENLAQLRGPDNGPVLDFTGFDTVEYLRGGEVAIKDLFSGVARIKVSEDLGIGITRPGLRVTQEIMNMADTYLKIIDINKYPCVYGIKPKTMIYAVIPDQEKGFPHIDLVPIV